MTDTNDDNGLIEIEKPGTEEAGAQEQLTMFFLEGPLNKRFSHSIEHLIGAPRFIRGKGATLPGTTQRNKIIERYYKDRKKEHKISISPAILKVKEKDEETGEDVEREYFFYPNTDVELIEEVLIKFGVEGSGKIINDRNGNPVFAVNFTIRQIGRELANRGHSRSPQEINHALEIGSKCSIDMSIPLAQGKWAKITSPIFKNLIRIDKEKYQEADSPEDKKCYVELHPLVVVCIHSGTFRLYNYLQSMSYKLPLATWFYRRLSHYYTQAGDPKGYTIHLSTLYVLYGFNRNNDRLSEVHKTVKKALDSMVNKDIEEWSYDLIRDENDKRKTVDYKYTIKTSENFKKAMIYFNEVFRDRNDDKKLEALAAAADQYLKEYSDNN